MSVDQKWMGSAPAVAGDVGCRGVAAAAAAVPFVASLTPSERARQPARRLKVDISKLHRAR